MRIFENRDCIGGMREYPDKHFDLAIVDPPYGIDVASKGQVGGSSGKIKATKFAKKDWDKEIPKPEYFTELFRVSKNQIIWGGNYFGLRATPCYIVWDKQNMGTDFADCELAWTSFNSAVRLFTYRWNGFLQQNMKRKEKRIHPTQKPVDLYRWLLQKYAKPGQLILDTHVGSASSLIAFETEGFDYVGYELDPDYYGAAVRRVEDFRKQPQLPIQAPRKENEQLGLL